MPPRWNTWAGVQPVQWDWEKQPKDRQVRLAAPTAHAGDPVRIRMAGAEVEGIIIDASTPVLRVKLKSTPVKAQPKRRTRTA